MTNLEFKQVLRQLLVIFTALVCVIFDPVYRWLYRHPHINVSLSL